MIPVKSIDDSQPSKTVAECNIALMTRCDSQTPGSLSLKLLETRETTKSPPTKDNQNETSNLARIDKII